MYSPLKSALLRLLRVPPEPTDPFGAAGSVLVFRAAPAYYRYRLVLWGLGHVHVLVGAGFALVALHAAGEAGAPVAVFRAIEVVGLVALAGEIVLSYLTLRLDYELRWYKVTDRSLRIREGVWIVREMTMTFANVQNISVSQGPLQRFLGIADVKVQSAGGGGAGTQGAEHKGGFVEMHVATFRGVDNAQWIRDTILERLKRLKDAGLGDLDDADDHAAASPLPAAAALAPMIAELHGEAAGLRAAAEALAARGIGRPGS